MAIAQAETALGSAQRNGRNRVAGPPVPARAWGSAEVLHSAPGAARPA
jgi:hypothetical protein